MLFDNKPKWNEGEREREREIILLHFVIVAEGMHKSKGRIIAMRCHAMLSIHICGDRALSQKKKKKTRFFEQEGAISVVSPHPSSTHLHLYYSPVDVRSEWVTLRAGLEVGEREDDESQDEGRVEEDRVYHRHLFQRKTSN